MGNVLPVEKIALIIFDEAHHAAPRRDGKPTKHAYGRILKSLREKEAHVRLLGLTASVINNRTKLQDVSSFISDLEDAFLGAECIVVDTEEVVRYKTNAEVIVWECNNCAEADPLTMDLLVDMTNKLQELHKQYEKSSMNFPIECKEAATVLVRLSSSLTEMSLWISRELCLEYDQELTENLSLYGESNQCYKLFLEAIIRMLRAIVKHFSKQISHLTVKGCLIDQSSPKLIRLLEILENYALKPKEFRGIMFVKTRLEAKALCKWIRKVVDLVPTLSFINVDYLTGYSSRPGFVDKISRKQAQHQHETLEKFRTGQVNFLVATSVLEEGLDIPACNCVIRYALPDTYRSYHQSMGRARARDAIYFLVCEMRHSPKLEKDLRDFEALGQKITELCKIDRARRELQWGITNSPLTAEQEILIQRELDQQNVVHPETGATITSGTAVNRVYEYLSSISFGFNARPEESYEPVHAKWKCEVRLPLCSPICEEISGTAFPNRFYAKKSAYLQVCRRLMDQELLDHHLKPLTKRVIVEKVIEKLDLGIPREEVAKGQPAPGTKARKQVYPMATAAIGEASNNEKFLYRIIIMDPSRPASYPELAILSSRPLAPQVLTSFVIFKTGTEIRVTIEAVTRIFLREEILTSVRWFHEFIFLQMLDFASRVEVLPVGDRKAFLMAPLTSERDIDVRYIQNLQLKERNRLPIIFNDEGYGIRLKNKFVFERENFVDAIVRPWYKTNLSRTPVRDRKSWFEECHVVESMEGSLDTVFPTKNATFGQHYKLYYNLDASEKLQPLLRVVPPTSMATLTPITRDREIRKIHLVPEFCEVCPMNASMWSMLSCLPVILHRLGQLQNAFDFRKYLVDVVHLDIDVNENFRDIDFIRGTVLKTKRMIEVNEENENDEDVEAASYSQRETDSEDSEDDDKEENKMLPLNGAGDTRPAHIAPKVVMKVEHHKRFATQPFRVFPAREKFLDSQFVSAIQFTPSTIPQIGTEELRRCCNAAIEDLTIVGNIFTPTNIRSTDHIAAEVQKRGLKRSLEEDTAAFDIVKSFDHRSLNVSFPPGLHIEAFTSKSAHDVCNSERLETLGDSFIKYVVSSFLHARTSCQTSDQVIADCLSEGHLTSIKGQLVSNYNLYRLSKKMRLAERMYVKMLDPKGNWMPPGFKEIPNRLEQFLRSTQEISDKVVADSVEALVGAIIVSLGERQAIRFLHWFGLPVVIHERDIDRERHWLPDIEPINQSMLLKMNSFSVMHQFFERSNLSRLENIINYRFCNKWFLIKAITHSSCIDNWITGSYEKIEFLGDSVLDWLIARYCFNYKKSEENASQEVRFDPGQMTDLRSALVNNAFLGCLMVKFDLHKHICLIAPEVKNQIDTFAETFLAYADKEVVTVGAYVMLMPSEAADESNVRHIEVPKVLGDVMEAIIGAIYLDSGRKLDPVWKVVHGLMKAELSAFVKQIPQNPIRRIYESDEGRKFFNGKQIDKNKYEVKLKFKGNTFTGVGRNRKFARLHAAMNALHKQQTLTV